MLSPYLQLIVFTAFAFYVVYVDPLAYKVMIIRLKGLRLRFHTYYTLFLLSEYNLLSRLMGRLYPRSYNVYLMRLVLLQKLYIRDIQAV